MKYQPSLKDLIANLPRLLAIGAILAAVVAIFACAGGWLSPSALSPQRYIDAFEAANGKHAGFRRNHAKGVCVSGYFDGNGNGDEISKAVLFKVGRTPVIGRFALAGGNPFAADTNDNVRSFALLFRLANGEEWRTGMNNIPVFPVSTPQVFYEQLIAGKPDAATGKPDPAAMKAFTEKYPETAAAVQRIKARAISSGFSDAAYNGLDAFYFVNAQGVKTPVRWSAEPVQPFAAASIQPGTSDKNRIFEALVADIERQPQTWNLVATIGGPGDPTNDAAMPWPDDRRKVELGTITIDKVESEGNGPCRDINFDPLVLPAGIVPSDDPLLSARSAVYSRSVTLRDGETKQDSAVSVTGNGDKQ